jgi:hypothetical protein
MPHRYTYRVIPLSLCWAGIMFVSWAISERSSSICAAVAAWWARETRDQGNTIREEVAALVKSNRWPAELLAPQPWNPSLS